MKRHGIERQTLLVALIPILVMAVSLESYFIFARFADLDSALLERSQMIARQLAFSSEYVIFSGNKALLQQDVDATLAQQDVTRVVVLDAKARPLMGGTGGGRGQYEVPLANANRSNPVYQDEKVLMLYQPIVATQIKLDELDRETGSASATSNSLGAVIIEISKLRLNSQKHKIILYSFATTLSILMATLMLALWAARRITRPIMGMSRVIRSIEEGNLDTRITPQPKVLELNQLASGFNQMAQKLQQDQTILERRVAERTAALQQGAERIEMLLNSVAEGIYGVDMQGNCTFINSAGLKLLGYQEESELIGKNTHELIHHTRPDGARYSAEESRLYHAMRSRENIHVDDEFFWRKDGSSFPVDYWSRPTELNGNFGAVITFFDITERILAEQNQNRLARAIQLMSKCDSVLVRAEKEQELLTEICRLAVETGGYLMAWVGYAEHDPARTIRPVAQAGREQGYLENANITWADTERGQGPTGTAIRKGITVAVQDFQSSPKVAPWREAAISRGYKSSIALPLSVNKQVLGAFTIYASEPSAFGKDEVTLLEELASDLAYGIQVLRTRVEAAQARQEAENANLAKSKFLASLSHDLRQPIHAQGLFMGALALTKLDTHQQEILASANAASKSSVEMLNALLDFSRMEAGIIKPELQSFKLQPLLNKIEREFGSQADKKGITYRSRETALVVLSDPMLVERILRNLVTNAISYTERGGILVACRKRGANAVLEVWDSGIGIATENQKLVFDEFVQLANPERDRQKGLGLGLAIVLRLAQTLKLDLSLVSTLGRGSVFRLSLPLATEIVPVEEAHPSPDILQKINMRVLVIDDDAIVLEGMRMLLRNWGCECDVAESIEEALDLVRTQAPEVIICDYRLREHRTGIEAIEALRALLGNAVPAILITGDTAPDRLREALASGIPILHKPLSPTLLYRNLVTMLPKH